MRPTLPFLLGLLLHLNAMAHDLQISLFEVGTNEDGHIELFVRLDKENILKEMYANCTDYSQINTCLESYLNEHFSLSFDQQRTAFELIDLNHTTEYIEMNLVTTSSITMVKQIEVFNDVLVADRPAQENILRLSFYDQNRSFRMNKDRIKTTITYK